MTGDDAGRDGSNSGDDGSNSEEDGSAGGPPPNPWDRADPAWPVTDQRVAWENPYFEAGYDVVERPDGEAGTYYWIDPDDAVMVVALDGDDLVLVEQYRPRHRARTLGVPGGSVDGDEDPAAAAARELREETGYVASDLEYLDSYAPTPWVRFSIHVFVARDLEPGDSDPEAGEDIDVELVPAAEAVDRVRGRSGPGNGLALGPLLLAREDGVI